ncbi:MAG TPA: thiamine pyrophosphate-dependent enzyme, partial [Thermoanaerobaculia bacterium]|nr:thiamine pyrophosphate-dependent enzyme [Thermoanaerobaculia bacterium]
ALCGRLAQVVDYLAEKSVWAFGGDGWAYDIGYGGLDHVLASNKDVNILVLDTEVYSNTGGQQSKATPLGAAAKFAANGKEVPKKDLGMLAMTYGHVYVSHMAFGAKDNQTVKAFLEADSWSGPSMLIAYSPCIAHGYDLSFSLDQQKLAVDSGYWPLYRFDPRRIPTGEMPLVMDSTSIKASLAQFMRNEARFRMVEQQNPARFRKLLHRAEREVRERFSIYENLAKITMTKAGAGAPPTAPAPVTPPAAAPKA